jgi:hypothetical protein
MRSFTSASPSWSSSRLGALLARALELLDLALDGLADLVGDVELRDPAPVVVGAALVGVAELAELLSDRLQLAAQEELSLGLLHPLFDVVLDPLAQRQVGQGVLGPRQDERQPVGDVQGLQDLHLLGEGQIGRVPGQVGQPARRAHLAQLGRDPAGSPAEQDVLEDGPVLAGERDGAFVVGIVLVDRLCLHPQGRPGAGHARADQRPPLAAHHEGRQPARQLAALDHLGHHADRPVAAVDVGHEQQHPARGADHVRGRPRLVRLQPDGEDHPGKHHPGTQGQHREGQGLVRHVSSDRQGNPETEPRFTLTLRNANGHSPIPGGRLPAHAQVSRSWPARDRPIRHRRGQSRL